jgi:hypothetical protein
LIIPAPIEEHLLSKLGEMCITRSAAAEATEVLEEYSVTASVPPTEQTTTCSTQATSNSVRAIAQNGGNNGQRRSNYRVLADMPDEDWGIPDVCLQKTAEVVFIAEAKNCRIAVGQLKVTFASIITR